MRPDKTNDVAAIRDRIATLQAEIYATASAPKAENETIAAARRELAERRDAFMRDLGLAGRWDAPPGAHLIPMTDLDSGWRALDLLLWTHPEEVEARVIEAIRADYSRRGTNGLPTDERAAKLQALRTRWLAELVREEECIRRAEADGFVVERREDAPAAVVLAFDLRRVTAADVEAE